MDDVLLAGGNKATLEMLKEKLMSRFKMSDMGDVSPLVGVQVTRDLQARSLAGHRTGKLHPGIAREVRHARLQVFGDACVRRGAVSDAAGRGPSGRGGKAAISSCCRQLHVPGPGDTLRHLVGRKTTGPQ